MFVNFRDGKKNPKKKSQKKKIKKETNTSGQSDGRTDRRTDKRTDGQTNGHKEGLQNRPHRLPGQNMQRPTKAGSAGELKCRIVVSDGQTNVVNLYIRCEPSA
jgi:hypothetical protein